MIAIGVAIGVGVGYIYNLVPAGANGQEIFTQYFPIFLLSLPTITLVYTLVFTMLQQIQRSGIRSVHQVPYWLPVTWEEHTLASLLALMLGFPLLSIALMGSAVFVFSFFINQVAAATGTLLAMIAAAFMAAATTEIFKILQIRFIGAVYKSSGRAAVWVRFIGSLLFFIIFYVIYFSITTGTNSLYFIQAVATGQSLLWFIPFVWLGLTLYSIMMGVLWQGAVYLAASVLFIAGLYFLSVYLNKRFGLYEPPAITISRGAYAPKTGLLGKLGFASVESALIRKDIKAFTRRRELMTAFILPIIFLIVPIMTNISGTQAGQGSGPAELSLFWLAYVTLFPSSVMAISLGSFITGEEGQNMWRIYMSPVSARNFVRSKYAFALFFALAVLPITATVGYFFILSVSLRAILILSLEAVFIAFATGALSLANGIKGADFNEVPRPRMVRPEWSIINLITCFAVSLAVLLPFIPYLISMFTGGTFASFINVYVATAISGLIAAVLSIIFYKIAVGNAQELFTKAEV